jgi:hypothetical protein
MPAGTLIVMAAAGAAAYWFISRRINGGLRMGKDALETVDLKDVEILAAGTWNGNKQVTITDADLIAFVASFDDITADDKLNYEPPAKLGHNEDQKILAADGLPAAGWVSKLKVIGGKLVADFKGVPKKLAEIIKAGGYKKVSSEFYQNYEIGGKKYPWVLKAVAFLGADVPAVKTIGDIAAQYAEGTLFDDNKVPYNAVEMTAGELAEWSQGDVDKLPDSAFAVIKSGGTKDKDGMTVPRNLRMLPYKGADGKVDLPHLRNALARLPQTDLTPAERSEAEKVLQKAAKDAGVEDVNKNTEQEDALEKEIRELLKLDEKADVLAIVKALVAKSEAQVVSLAEQTALSEKIKTIETKLAESEKVIAFKERDERVGKAISTGKITPAQKAWAEGYAMSDPKGFDAFVAAAPKVVDLSEKGSQANNPEDVKLTEADTQIAGKLGVTTEDLIKTRKQEVVR